MRVWHTAAITVGLAILYAPVFAPSMSPPALLAGVLGICLVFAILDGLIFVQPPAAGTTPPSLRAWRHIVKNENRKYAPPRRRRSEGWVVACAEVLA